jgi:tetratricopeptide (TPR) repeat protein
VFCPPWSLERMTLGYWLAIIPTLGILTGVVAMLRAVPDRPTTWLLLVMASGATFLAMVALVATVPYYGHAKAFYGLMTLAPLAVFSGWGLDCMAGSRRLQRALLWGAVLIWAGNSYATFWVQDGAQQRAIKGVALLSEGDERGLAVLRSALVLDPQEGLARVLLAESELHRSGHDSEARALLELAPGHADSARREMALATLHAREFRLAAAEASIRRAIEIDPDDRNARLALAAAVVRRDPTGAIDAYREALRIDPFDPKTHSRLASLYRARGQAQQARLHERYAERLAPLATR